MRRRLPPLKALPAFEAAAEHASFSAAALALNQTHGAISRQVKALEDHLGVRLFRRLHRRVELTGAGTALLPPVRQALHLLESSAGMVADHKEAGTLLVSCLATCMMRWLMPRLYAFQADHPQIQLHLSASHAPVDFARDGVDLAIRLGKPPWPRNVAAHPFLRDHFGPVCAPALARARKLERPSDLRAHRLLQVETRPQGWGDWLRQVGLTRIDAAAGPRFERTYFLLEAAAGGLGVAIGSYPLVEQDLKSGRLVAPFGFVPSDQFYTLLHPRRTASQPRTRAFRSWLLKVAAADPALPPDYASSWRGVPGGSRSKRPAAASPGPGPRST
jgi:DNA-binding transcriptional LysR family regulator